MDDTLIHPRHPYCFTPNANGPCPNTPPPNPINILHPVMLVFFLAKYGSVEVIFKILIHPPPTNAPTNSLAREMTHNFSAKANIKDAAAARNAVNANIGSGPYLSIKMPNGI